MQNHPSTIGESTMKSIATKKPSLSTTTKWLVGLTLFYFIVKTFGNR